MGKKKAKSATRTPRKRAASTSQTETTETAAPPAEKPTRRRKPAAEKVAAQKPVADKATAAERAAQVEQSDSGTVIRFPPVARPPANVVSITARAGGNAAPKAAERTPETPAVGQPPASRPPARESASARAATPAEPPASAQPPAREAKREAGPGDGSPARSEEEAPRRRRSRRGGRGRRKSGDEAGSAVGQAPPRPQSSANEPRAPRGEGRPSDAPHGESESESDRRLSPSQRRRERRRRRLQRLREQREAGVNGDRLPEETDTPDHADDESGDGRAEAAVPLSVAVRVDDGDAPSRYDVDGLVEVMPTPTLPDEDEDSADDLATAEEAAEPTGEAEPREEGAAEGRGKRRRGRGRGRTRERRRFSDDEAAPTDAEQYAGILEPDETPPQLLLDIEEGDAAPEPERPIPTDLNVPAAREMIINVVPREECRIAILEHGKLEEIYMERASSENHVGNIYKGIVTNVESSIQAAFVDFGLGKNGFLHISDLHPQHFPAGERQTENVGRKMPRKSRPPIQKCLRRGQELLVQITKEGIGTKGPTLTTYLAIPGRFLVLMPGMRRMGVSRKIEDDSVRDALKSAMRDMDLPDDMGFIARTAAQGRTKRDLQSDLNYLSRLWKAVERRIRTEKAPAELYRESDLLIRTIRDVFTTDIDRIIVDDLEVAERAREFLALFSPRSRDAVLQYQGPAPIFHRYGIEAELERLHSRHVPLRSGGSLVIDQTEALVAIDVNSGRYRAEDDAEATALKINIEAADEIPRQLRLRDLGGVIICDFIDMRHEENRREVERRLILNLKKHKERAKVLRISAFGIIEMTRQRQRASLTRSVYQDCHHCRGTGLVKTVESVALDVMRLLQLTVTRENVVMIEVTVSPEVASLLQNRKRGPIHDLETRNRRTIVFKPENTYGLDQVQVHCYDARNRLVQP